MGERDFARRGAKGWESRLRVSYLARARGDGERREAVTVGGAHAGAGATEKAHALGLPGVARRHQRREPACRRGVHPAPRSQQHFDALWRGALARDVQGRRAVILQCNVGIGAVLEQQAYHVLLCAAAAPRPAASASLNDVAMAVDHPEGGVEDGDGARLPRQRLQSGGRPRTAARLIGG